jgi:hypothetical protein
MERAVCAQCGAEHDLEVMDVAFQHPDPFLQIDPSEYESRCWAVESTDVRQIDGTHSYIRAILPLPLVDEPRDFAWGPWVEVDYDHLAYYVEHFTDDLTADPPFPGKLATDIKVYDVPTLGLDVEVRYGNSTQRPTLRVMTDEHPLGWEQRHGVTIQRVLEFHHAYAPSTA